jgi:hypothetical protein
LEEQLDLIFRDTNHPSDDSYDSGTLGELTDPMIIPSQVPSLELFPLNEAHRDDVVEAHPAIGKDESVQTGMVVNRSDNRNRLSR